LFVGQSGVGVAHVCTAVFLLIVS